MIRSGTTRQRPWWTAHGLLAALVGLALLAAGILVGAVPAAAQNRVGASTPAMINTVGVSTNIGAGQRLGKTVPQPQIVVATGVAAEPVAGASFPRFVAGKQGIIDTEAPALRSQIGDVVDSMRTSGGPPPGVRQGGLPGKPGVYGNKNGALPSQPEGYYSESDVWPGPGPRGAERVVTGSGGEAWYTPDHYGTFRPWPW